MFLPRRIKVFSARLQAACALADLGFVPRVLQGEFVKLYGAPDEGFGRGGGVIQCKKGVFATPVSDFVLQLFRQPERQLALCGGVG